MKKLLLLFAVLLIGGLTAATFTACSDDDDDPVAIDSTSIPVRWAIEYEFEWGGDAANQAELQKFLGETYIQCADDTKQKGMKFATSVTAITAKLNWGTSADFKLVADVSENYTPSLDSLLLDWTCDIEAVAYNNKGEKIPGLVAETTSTGHGIKVALTEENIAGMRKELFPFTDKITFTAEDNYISFTRR